MTKTTLMLKPYYLLALALLSSMMVEAQTTDPVVVNWMINTTGITGRHYVQGNSTPITDTAQANVQKVQYSATDVYINASGIPAYIVGPYLDGNPSLATHNDWLFQIPLVPVENTGTLTSTPFGPIGVFINGVPIYDFKDGASYNLSTGMDDMQNGDGVWNRNAVMAENDGFDCAKGHPSPIFSGGPPPQGTLDGGSYHHHQNPTAFNLDLSVVSNVCDLYLADGLYTLDSTQHSPLIGFAFDGFPIYGGYGYANADGTGGIKRIESSYQKRNITMRTHYADGTDVTDGPPVNSNFPLGWYREDYEFITGSGDLDDHNGRANSVTPEYPNGTYAYYATVDQNWNSAFPYVIGLEYYGIVVTDNFVGGGGNSVTITGPTTVYNPSTSVNQNILKKLNVNVFPNPATDLIAIQADGLITQDLLISMFDMQGKLVKQTTLNQGSTIWHLDTRTLYSGEYLVQISTGENAVVKKVVIQRD